MEKVIAAHGGADNLKRWNTGFLKAKIKTLKGMPIPESVDATWEDTFQLPGQLRRVAHFTGEGKEGTITYVISGDQAWERKNGVTRAIDSSVFTGRLSHLYWVFPGLPNLAEDGVKLSLPGEVISGERPAIRLRAETGDGRSFEFDIDRTTWLLVKVRGTSRGREVNDNFVDTVLGDYQETDRCKLPRRITIYYAGKIWADMQIQEARCLENIDEGVFAEP